MHGPLPEVTQSTTIHIKFVPPVSGLLSLVETQTSTRVLQLQSSLLWVPDAAL